MFKKPFSFEGRIRRTEFGLSYLIYIVAVAILSLTMSVIRDLSELVPFIGMVIFIPLIWFLIAQRAKRCHDRGNSGWFQLIPFYGLWMLFADSEIGENAYGPNPKGIGNYEEIGQDLIA
jgi:uncharacterized membrane protein YhaH (DUF805 family)